MDVEIFNDEDDAIPIEIINAAEEAAHEVLPTTSKLVYMKAYHQFEKWSNEKNVKRTSEKVMMAYFLELSKKMKPSSLWAHYSMLKTTIRVKENVDMATFHQLVAFLKSKSSGYRPVKASVFTELEIQRFIVEAPDADFLDVKVACIFAISGALRTDELVNINVQDIEPHGDDLLLVRIKTSTNKSPRSFTISGAFYPIVKKYWALRSPGTLTNRFFVNYQRGRCTSQVIGKNKLSGFPRKIATFLQLDGVEGYSGHSFRLSSTTILANTDASIETIKRHGTWISATVAEGYIEESLHYKRWTGDIITSTITSAKDALVDPLQLAASDTVGELEKRSDELQGVSEVSVEVPGDKVNNEKGSTDAPQLNATLTEFGGSLKSLFTFNINVNTK